MPTVRFTRVVEFSAAHRYFRPEWSAERNAEAFGACGSEYGHGHRYECAVTVEGPVDGETSMVMNLDALDRVLREEVTERFDHRHLNYDVPEFAFGKTVPTAEALAIHIWDRIAPRLPSGVRLRHIRVQEEPHLYAEYHGGT
jgi:6-pyruvoyltetrahydropterin/6-carboxytetrahydropterin synthase